MAPRSYNLRPFVVRDWKVFFIPIFREESRMERIQDVSKLVYTHVQGGQFRWVTVSTLMLALGTILH